MQRPIAIHSVLVPYVRSIAVEDGEGNSSAAVYKVMPSPFPVLGFQYRGSLNSLRGNTVTKLEQAGMTGLQSTVRLFQGTAGTHSILVVLQPYAAFALARQRMEVFTDSHIGWSHIFENGRANSLGDELSSADSINEATGLIQRFLCARFEAAQNPSHPTVIEASEILLRSSNMGVARLAKHLHISERQLERLFRRQIGIGPKQFASLTRFHRVLQQMSANRPWAEVAADAGYADQAHFIRSFSAYAGVTPGRFQEQHTA